MIVEKLTALVSEVGMAEFAERIEVLQQLCDIWSHGGKAIVVEETDTITNEIIGTYM